MKLSDLQSRSQYLADNFDFKVLEINKEDFISINTTLDLNTGKEKMQIQFKVSKYENE